MKTKKRPSVLGQLLFKVPIWKWLLAGMMSTGGCLLGILHYSFQIMCKSSGPLFLLFIPILCALMFAITVWVIPHRGWGLVGLLGMPCIWFFAEPMLYYWAGDLEVSRMMKLHEGTARAYADGKLPEGCSQLPPGRCNPGAIIVCDGTYDQTVKWYRLRLRSDWVEARDDDRTAKQSDFTNRQHSDQKLHVFSWGNGSAIAVEPFQ